MKKTGRLPRTHISNTIHHVMIRGNNRQKIFLNKICFNYFLKIIEESIKKFDHRILTYCLMTNHAHLVIHIHNDSLSNVMKNISFRYARWFNKKYKRIGHLFQGRYRSIAVDDENYLLNLCYYIHFNPVEAKIVSHPDYYQWSSHYFYFSQTAPEWMEINLMLTVIKNKTGNLYSEFINKPVNREKWKPGLFLSENGDLVIDTEVVCDLHPVLNIDERKQKKKSLSQDVVADVVCENLNINYARLLGGSRNRIISRKRTLLVYFWREYSTMSIADIAKQLSRTQGTLQRQLDRLEQDGNYFSPELMNRIQAALYFALQQSVVH